jgi:hypothetical protein
MQNLINCFAGMEKALQRTNLFEFFSKNLKFPQYTKKNGKKFSDEKKKREGIYNR